MPIDPPESVVVALTTTANSHASRYRLLDIVRGFAIVGIIPYNMVFLSGFAFATWDGEGDVGKWDYERWLLFLVVTLIKGKFYSIFALLLGFGFAVSSERREATGQSGAARFRNRLIVMFCLGMLHATLVWYGDILHMYAVLGVSLLVLRKVQDTTLLRCAIGFLVMPILQAGLLNVLTPEQTLATVARGQESAAFRRLVEGVRTGGYGDVIQWNLYMLRVLSVNRLVNAAPARIIGMFLLGCWLGRHRAIEQVSGQQRVLRLLLLYAGTTGILLSIGGTYLATGKTTLESSVDLATVFVDSCGVLLLSSAFVAGLCLLYDHKTTRGPVSVFGPVGRMALTNYLAQSVLGVLIFSNMGLKCFAEVPYGSALVTSVGVAALEVSASWVWLRRFQQGPVEAGISRLLGSSRGNRRNRRARGCRRVPPP